MRGLAFNPFNAGTGVLTLSVRGLAFKLFQSMQGLALTSFNAGTGVYVFQCRDWRLTLSMQGLAFFTLLMRGLAFNPFNAGTGV